MFTGFEAIAPITMTNGGSLLRADPAVRALEASQPLAGTPAGAVQTNWHNPTAAPQLSMATTRSDRDARMITPIPASGTIASSQKRPRDGPPSLASTGTNLRRATLAACASCLAVAQLLTQFTRSSRKL